MAHPSPVVAAVLAEPQFTPTRIDVTAALTRTLTVVLAGLTRPR
jgi:hypothetical protein